MQKTSRVRVFIASSLDGFIAGPDDDISWLPTSVPSEDPRWIDFGDFLGEVGALLMGRQTYRVVEGFDGEWPYGERPVLVATTRTLTPANTHVRAVRGDIAALIEMAKEAAGDKDVYLDGGMMIRQALDAGLVDELTLTWVPVLLGQGHALFSGLTQQQSLALQSTQVFEGGLVQMVMQPKRRA